MKSVASQFAEILAAAGVKRVYGIVGDSLNGLTDVIRAQGKIEWVHVRHEEVPPAVTVEMAKGFSLYMVGVVMNGRTDEIVDLAKSNLWR